MATVNRPLSPHLQVYSPQITSVLSILHRITGALLAIGTLPLVYWLWALAAGPAVYESATAFLSSWFVQVLLFAWTFALFYHLCNGIRHLAWDAGYGLELTSVHRSGKAVVIVAVVLTIFTWLVA